MGVNQGHEATRTAQAIINLALMTGNIGRPGTGANSHHRPVQRDGLAAFRQHHEPARRPRFPERGASRRRSRGMLGIPTSSIPAQNSLAYDQIVRRHRRREDQRPVGHRHERLALVDSPGRVQRAAGEARFPRRAGHVSDHRDAQRAHLVLPAAGWGEKEGTFINSERRIGLVKKVARAPGQALARFQHLPAHRAVLGLRRRCSREWTSPEAVFQILKELSRGQPCDITGIETTG